MAYIRTLALPVAVNATNLGRVTAPAVLEIPLAENRCRIVIDCEILSQNDLIPAVSATIITRVGKKNCNCFPLYSEPYHHVFCCECEIGSEWCGEIEWSASPIGSGKTLVSRVLTLDAIKPVKFV